MAHAFRHAVSCRATHNNCQHRYETGANVLLTFSDGVNILEEGLPRLGELRRQMRGAASGNHERAQIHLAHPPMVYELENCGRCHGQHGDAVPSDMGCLGTVSQGQRCRWRSAHFGMRSRTWSGFHLGMTMVGTTAQTLRMHPKWKP